MRFAAICLLLIPSLAEAREWHIAGGATVHVVRASSFDAVSTSDTLTQGELAVGVEEDLELFGVIDHVGLDLRWSTGGTSANSFELVEAGLWVHDFQLGLSARHDFYPWLGAYARAALGVARAELSLENDFASDEWTSDADWAHAAQLGLGAELSADAPNLGIEVGLRVEAGLAATGDFAFVARRHGETSGRPLDTRASNLGDVDLDGMVYRFVAFGRF